ncbi:hypothetical protein ARMSODRAFT_1011418 [Armillaria solidipes]|uniref:HNH nuclease domain-containing protein n=1 Tax=Armillaria solidipes TaxID=1076256 RepID=A0A2H3CC37_9AGAR|nr:hypothetical protein ARMSODRAFT_1011418 [Armillaria solidipes]
MASLLIPRSYCEEATDPWEPIFIVHPIHDCPFLSLGRRQKVIETDKEQLGIPHWFVLDACLVVAGRGFLSSTPDRSNRISTEENGLLTGRKYWFFLEDDDSDYVICTDFMEWTPLPRKEVPERWLAIDQHKKSIPNPLQEESFSDISSCITQKDRICALSGVNEEIHAVHLIPQMYATWYHSHTVFLQFARFPSPLTAPKARPIDDIRQIITLESGLRDSMDRPSFVFAPFGDKYTAFFFAPRNISMVERYHMRNVRLPERIEGYALFARFAWAMTTIAFALPPNIVNRKRKCSDTSNQQPLYQRLKTEGDGPTTGDSDGGGRASQPSFEDESDDDDDDGCVDPSSLLDFLKEQELELTDHQVEQFRDAEDGTQPSAAFIYDILE